MPRKPHRSAGAADVHESLLRIGGRVPDSVLTEARDALADGNPAAAEKIAADLPPLTSQQPAHDFVASPQPPGTPPLLVLDLSGGVDLDPADAAGATAAAGCPGAVGLWRAWRRAVGPDRRPVRVYLLLTIAERGDLPATTRVMHAALRAAGIETPQVEVYRPDTELPPYHRLARGRSALLWAAEPPAPITIAREFDSVDPGAGPAFDADHPILSEGDEPRRVLDYLRGAEVLLATTGVEPDLFDSTLGDVVPQSFRTDGAWIWTDTVTYYLQTYRLSPEIGLLQHIRSRNYRLPDLDDVARHRALAVLFQPVPEPA